VRIYNGHNCIGFGTVVNPAHTVHSHKLTDDEVKVLVEEIDIDRHPIFNYEMEKGLYIAWKVENVEIV